MDAKDGLMILTKLENLERYSRTVMLQFPKNEKFLLSAEIRQQLLSIRRNTVRAAKKFHKKTTLQDLDIDIEILRGYIRIAYGLKYINEHRLMVWIGIIDEIGRMVGAWLKNQK